MRVKTVDLVQIHNLVDWQTHIATLRKLKEEKKLDIWESLTIIEEHTMKSKNSQAKLFDFVQFNLSPIEPVVEARLLPTARETEHAVIVNRPFVGGQIFRKTAGIPCLPGRKTLIVSPVAQFCLKYFIP